MLFRSRVARHRRCGDLLKAGLTELGMELFGDPANRLPMLTCVMIPDGVDDATVRQRLLREYDVVLVAHVGHAPCGLQGCRRFGPGSTAVEGRVSSSP